MKHTPYFIHTQGYFIITTITTCVIICLFYWHYPAIILLLIERSITDSILISPIKHRISNSLYEKAIQARILASLLLFVLIRFFFDTIPTLILQLYLLIRSFSRSVYSFVRTRPIASQDISNQPKTAEIFIQRSEKNTALYSSPDKAFLPT